MSHSDHRIWSYMYYDVDDFSHVHYETNGWSDEDFAVELKNYPDGFLDHNRILWFFSNMEVPR